MIVKQDRALGTEMGGCQGLGLGRVDYNMREFWEGRTLLYYDGGGCFHDSTQLLELSIYNKEKNYSILIKHKKLF